MSLISKWKEEQKKFKRTYDNVDDWDRNHETDYINVLRYEYYIKDLTESLVEIERLIDGKIERKKTLEEKLTNHDEKKLAFKQKYRAQGLEQAKQYKEQTLGGRG